MNETAFVRFYEKTAPALKAYLRKVGGSSDLADDLFQETILRFLRASLPDMTEPQLKSYLYKTATTVLADHWRRAKRERLLSFAWLLPSRRDADTAIGTDVAAAFQELKPKERALLWLAYVEGFDHREIAAALGLNEKSIRVLLFRARRRLANMLQNEGIVAEVET